MIIGSFTYNKEQDTYLGDIRTLNFDIHSVAFKPVERKGEKEPDYRITAPTEYGGVELGAGWKRTSDKGKDFVSIALDGPLLPAPVNAALFLEEDGEMASMVWNRVKPKTKSDSTKKTA